MSNENGQYEYDQESLDWLKARSEEYFIKLFTQSENKDGPVYRDTVLMMAMVFHISHDEAIARIQAWVEWNSYSWHIVCENEDCCGCGIDFDHFTSSHSCVCGATYVVDGWREYHRDDTLGGRITTSIGDACGTVMKTLRLGPSMVPPGEFDGFEDDDDGFGDPQ